MKTWIILICIPLIILTACNITNDQKTNDVIQPTQNVQITGEWTCESVDGEISPSASMLGVDAIIKSVNSQIKQTLKDLLLSYFPDKNFQISYDSHVIKGRYNLDQGLLNHFDGNNRNVFIQDIKITQASNKINFHINGTELLNYFKANAKEVPNALWNMINVSDFKIVFTPKK